MATRSEREIEAQQLAEQHAQEIAANAHHLAEVKADEAAVLNGHCPDADAVDFLDERRQRLDS